MDTGLARKDTQNESAGNRRNNNETRTPDHAHDYCAIWTVNAESKGGAKLGGSPVGLYIYFQKVDVTNAEGTEVVTMECTLVPSVFLFNL